MLAGLMIWIKFGCLKDIGRRKKMAFIIYTPKWMIGEYKCHFEMSPKGHTNMTSTEVEILLEGQHAQHAQKAGPGGSFWFLGCSCPMGRFWEGLWVSVWEGSGPIRCLIHIPVVPHKAVAEVSRIGNV